jgi:hypothetical protein
MRRCRLATTLVVVLCSCRTESGGASAPDPAEETGARGSHEREPGDSGIGTRDDPPDCGAKGRVWEGKLAGCLYEHGGCCYDTPAAACEAAGCTHETCRILESSPAQLYCAS